MTPLLDSLPWKRVLRWGGVMLGTAVLIGLVGRWAEQRELQLKTQALQQSAQANTLGLIGITEKHGFLPYVAARHPDLAALLQHPADARMRVKVNHYLSDLQQHTDATALYVMSHSGLTLAASNWATSNSYVGQLYNQRPYFTEALQGRRSFFYGVGLTTGEPGFFIAEPVVLQQAVIGVVVVKVSLNALSQSWSSSPDPIVLMDQRHIVFLSSEPQWLYRSRHALSKADLGYLRQHGQYGARGEFAMLPWVITRSAGATNTHLKTTLRGEVRELLALETTVPGLQWSITVTSDLRSVAKARQEALALASLTAVALLLATLYWQSREQRLVEQRRARQELEQRVQERTRELEEAHAFRKAMEDTLAVGMQARDPDGRIIYINRAFSAMLGFEASALLGCTPPYPYWPAKNGQPPLLDEPSAALNTALPLGVEHCLRHCDGHEVHTLIYTAPLIDAAGQHQGWMSSVVDVTAQRAAESRQREQDRQLQRSARLASLGEMASTLAHELNQPLMAVSNFALAARAIASQSDQPMLVSALDEIVEQSGRASDIVKRVRGVINPRHGSYLACDIQAVVTHALTLLRHELTLYRVQVQVDMPTNLPLVRANRVLLEQVLVNLLQNAAQAIDESNAPRRDISILAWRHPSTIEIRLADSGPGIPPELLEQVFTPFFSTRTEGLGLGLNICRTIIEAHGGHLLACNRATGGAEFSFNLPLNS